MLRSVDKKRLHLLISKYIKIILKKVGFYKNMVYNIKRYFVKLYDIK